MIREKIAKRVNDWYHHFDREDGFIIADQIIKDFCTEIENLEIREWPDYLSMSNRPIYKRGIEDCCQKILNLLKGGKE